MSDINQIVQVDITIENPRVTRQGFGVPLIMGVNAAFAERVRTYLDLEGVGADFPSTSEEYTMAAMVFGQALSPTQLLIGRREATSAQANDITIAGTPLEDDVFSVVINRVTYSYTALAAPTPTSVAAGLAGVIDAATELTAVSSLGVITVSATNQDDSFVIGAGSTTSVAGTIAVAADPATTVETLADTIDAIDAENPDYYGLLVAKRGTTADSVGDILEASAQAESREKLYAYSTDEADALTTATTDIFSVLQALSRARSTGIYSATALEYPEAGWFGLQLPKDAGTTNWKFKTISGATPSILTGTQYINLKGKNANFIENVGGKNVVSSEGVLANGEYIDVQRGVDSTKAEIQEDTYGYLTSKDKVPFTNAGMIATAGYTQAVLVRKARLGLYVESSIVVNVPDVSDISKTDKANRQFKGTTFSAELQDAINFVGIKGTVYR